MAFYTEKQTEDWLAREIRSFTLCNGHIIHTSQFRMTWATLDKLITQYDISLDWIVETAQDNARDLKIDFELSLHNITAHIDNLLREKFED